MKTIHKRIPARSSPLGEGMLARLLDPESQFAINYPHAHTVMRDLHRADIAIKEFSQIQYATKLSVLGGCIVLLYWSGKTVVQGNVFEGGAIWQVLKDVLPENTVWQR